MRHLRLVGAGVLMGRKRPGASLWLRAKDVRGEIGVRGSLLFVLLLSEEGKRRRLSTGWASVLGVEGALESLDEERSIDGEVVRGVWSELEGYGAVFVGTREE